MAHQRNLEIVERYTGKVSGTRARRTGLDQMMAEARRDSFEVLLVWACHRIAGSIRHFVEVPDELSLAHRRGLAFAMRSPQDDSMGSASSQLLGT
jgi:DNA invertase Pin-like site-specific DNA recombinase